MRAYTAIGQRGDEPVPQVGVERRTGAAGEAQEHFAPPALQPRLSAGSVTITVSEIDLASNLDMNGHAPVPPVFSTSRMIALMEFAASQCIEPLLAEGELSVGASVDVRHTAATPLGVPVTAHARYLGAEGKLHRFEVWVTDPAGEVGRGTHARAIIDRARLLAGAEKRRPSEG